MSRAKTGLARPIPIPVNLSVDEDELLSRDAFATNRSKADILRHAYFRGDLNAKLSKLRSSQSHIKKPNFRREK